MASSTITTMTTLLFSIILFSHIAHGGSNCHRPAVLKSTRTGRVVEAKPEWKVEIINPCVCSYIHLALTTEPRNFEPAVPINPYILRKAKSEKYYWIVNNGFPFRRTFSFKYVGDAVKFKVILQGANDGPVLDQSTQNACLD